MSSPNQLLQEIHSMCERIIDENHMIREDIDMLRQQQQQQQQENQYDQMDLEPQTRGLPQEQSLPANPVASNVKDGATVAVVYNIGTFATLDTVSAVEPGSQFYTQVFITSYEPENIENWYQKYFPACNREAPMTDTNCPTCHSTDLENALIFSMTIQDVFNNSLLVYGVGDDVANLFPGVDIYSTDERSRAIIKQYMDGAKTPDEIGRPLELGIEVVEDNICKAFKLVHTKFV